MFKWLPAFKCVNLKQNKIPKIKNPKQEVLQYQKFYKINKLTKINNYRPWTQLMMKINQYQFHLNDLKKTPIILKDHKKLINKK